jgi:hypothetical protein
MLCAVVVMNETRQAVLLSGQAGKLAGHHPASSGGKPSDMTAALKM